MSRLGDMVLKVRSKNAGPFWLTVDIFCGTPDAYAQVCASVTGDRVAALFKVSPDTVDRYEMASLNVVKFSLPRPAVQGTREDRDMHGASFAALVAELDV
ncbi:DUF4387 family protein [Litoreibacter arenae]|uniref:DUF4387 domain-containing protein n=1 Tax=Litoreibacter arenae DSM 19593 TaxID=1123360 RepID=S9RUB6_9RHOB|nr:DUF4387 family protein [Litoreibacter arenae]EPX81600.1 hypothetical protein thalar_00155 [Litoreibacter arenae DSM 19593]